MLCQGEVDGITTVTDVIATCCYLHRQMFCQGMADRSFTLLQWQMVGPILGVFWQMLDQGVANLYLYIKKSIPAFLPIKGWALEAGTPKAV